MSELRINTHEFKTSYVTFCVMRVDWLFVTKNVIVGEVVALFLHILVHNLKNRTIKAILLIWGKLLSRQFHFVLKAVHKVGKKYIKKDHAALHEGDYRWKWFNRALGPLDGTHIPLTFPIEDQGRYRNRKGGLSTNILGGITWLGGIHIGFSSVA